MIRLAAIWLAASLSGFGSAAAQPAVERLLAADEAPTGVVFEIVEGERDALGWALPQARRLAVRLREHFPDLPVAVVTHGSEQFALLGSEIGGELDSIHDEARGLQDDAIDLHVCGTHAGWYGHDAEAFPGYVDVAASGPAQINDYEKLGFAIIRLERNPP